MGGVAQRALVPIILYLCEAAKVLLPKRGVIPSSLVSTSATREFSGQEGRSSPANEDKKN